MKLKQSFRYQLADYKAGILVYYCAMLGLLALFLVSTVVDTGVTVVFSGLSGFSCIFLFICGLCSLHDNLPMHLQHGVSRRTMFRARLLVTAAVSAFMAAVDTLLSVLLNLLSTPFYGGSLFQQLYGRTYYFGAVGNVLMSLVFAFVLFLLASSLGYFIITLFYRLTKPLRIALGIALAFLFLPGQIIVKGADQLLFHNALARLAERVIWPLMDKIDSSVFLTMGWWLIAAAALSGVTWLILRRCACCR